MCCFDARRRRWKFFTIRSVAYLACSAFAAFPLPLFAGQLTVAQPDTTARNGPPIGHTKPPQTIAAIGAVPVPEAGKQTEMRAMWVVRDSLESPAAIAHIVATAKRYGFNALFVQVRGRGDSWYKSSYEPRAEELKSQPPSFDPLALIVAEAHAQGIQVHAWLNTCYVWSSSNRPLSRDHIVNAHPDWLARDVSGAYHISTENGAEGAFLSPSNEQVRAHLHNVFLEVVRNYDIDGIHFDYIRYPNHTYDFSPATLQAFADAVRPTLPGSESRDLDLAGPAAYQRQFPQRWADWRRKQVTTLLEWISADVKKTKPWVCVSAAVYADWNDAFVERGQDWHQWLRDGALDAVAPMAYNASTMLVARQISDAEAVARDAHRVCYAGIGAWHIPEQSAAEKIKAIRADGAAGFVLFSYGGVTNNGMRNNYLAALALQVMSQRVSVPVLSSVAPRSASLQANSAAAGTETSLMSASAH